MFYFVSRIWSFMTNSDHDLCIVPPSRTISSFQLSAGRSAISKASIEADALVPNFARVATISRHFAYRTTRQVSKKCTNNTCKAYRTPKKFQDDFCARLDSGRVQQAGVDQTPRTDTMYCGQHLVPPCSRHYQCYFHTHPSSAKKIRFCDTIFTLSKF